MTLSAEVETLLYALSRIFLLPVLLLIAAALIYALVALGAFLVEAWQRRQGSHRRALLIHACQDAAGAGNGLTLMASDDLELWILKRLEWLRVVSRSAPMLGLIATMIPMGPALLALGHHDGAEVGRNMVAAFSSVILALMAASICFLILTIRRRWLLQDLRDIERQRELAEQH